MAGFFDIVLLLRLSYGSGRDVLHGFSTAVRRDRLNWRLHVVNFELGRAAEDVRRIVEAGAAGIVAHGLSGGVGAVAAAFGGPVVVIGPRAQNAGMEAAHAGPLAFVDADNAAIARVGASHLLSLGRVRGYAFIAKGPASPRFAAFRAALEPRHGPVALVVPAASDGETYEESMARQLRELPKPAAVMAEKDELARLALDAAAGVGIKVPKQMALLGVDNDELLCETADPPLSSVAVDHERLGALAVEALKKLFAHPDAPPFELLAPATGVVERQSARPVAPAAALAERAAAFIRHNAVKGIGAVDVAAYLGVSRSLADLRFRQVHGESMLGMILRLRLEAVKKKLRETDLPIGQVTASCGFGSESRAKHLFKARFGLSMREWRTASRR